MLIHLLRTPDAQTVANLQDAAMDAVDLTTALVEGATVDLADHVGEKLISLGLAEALIDRADGPLAELVE